jgi:hypothetical protein
LAVAGQEEVVTRVKIATRRNARCGRLECDRWNASILISGGQRSVKAGYVAEAFWWGYWKGKVAKTSTTGTSPTLIIYILLTDIIDTWTCALRLPEVFVEIYARTWQTGSFLG